MSKDPDSSVVDRVRGQIQAIIKEELLILQGEKKRLNSLVDDAEKKIEGLLESYRDVEKTLGDLKTMSILGLTSDTVKVVKIRGKDLYGSIRDDGVVDVDVNVDSMGLFNSYSTGRYFKLRKDREYRLLVAFIEEEWKVD